MYNLYQGKQPCVGCGKTGEENPRPYKDKLCYDCAQIFEIGRAVVQDFTREFGTYKSDEFTVCSMKWYSIRSIEMDFAIRKLLHSFSHLDKKYVKNGSMLQKIYGNSDAITSQEIYVLPVEIYNAAKELCGVTDKLAISIENEKRIYREQLNQELIEQKNQIYNEGVEHGRNLLMQLNNGEIGVNEFHKPVVRFT